MNENYRLTHSVSELSGFACTSSLTINENYRLTHSASELSGYTCTSSLTMNEKFQYRSNTNVVLKISSSLLVNEWR